MTKSLTLSIVLCGCDFLHFFSISKIDRVFQYRSTSTVKTSTDPPPVGLLQITHSFTSQDDSLNFSYKTYRHDVFCLLNLTFLLHF
ncbi:hypothetical protein ERO13_D01G097650v2 [Gossypium hirsutum]|nr:hypothetical protein ERO13_D01G097650v2 [Gossypium hirsutum]